MPSINVRLTEGQHEALRAEAFERRLSIQKVVVGRLFGNGLEAAAAEGGGGEAQRSPATGSSHVAETGEAETDAGVAAGRTDSSRQAAASKSCSRKARHHINHGGNPCPECGWPAKAGE